MARWTSLLHLLQVAMMGVAVIGAAVLVYTGYRFVLEPVGLLKQAIGRLQGGDLGARVDDHGSPPTSSAPWLPASTAWPVSSSRCTAAGRPGPREDRASSTKNGNGWKASTRSPRC